MDGESVQLSQKFSIRDDRLTRTTVAGRFRSDTYIALEGLDPTCIDDTSLEKTWAISQLRGAPVCSDTKPDRSIKIVDLFCGGGGFSAGMDMAATAVGLKAEYAACLDLDPVALGIFSKNHDVHSHSKLRSNIESVVDYAVRFEKNGAVFAFRPEITHSPLALEFGKVDFLIGGPPCQGHSHLNNHTRGSDKRNTLYLTVPAVGVALDAEIIVIENVPEVLGDSNRIVDKAIELLRPYYHVDTGIVEAHKLGVAQTRRRHFLIAAKKASACIRDIHDHLVFPELSSWDAISDLECGESEDRFDLPADISAESQRRIDYLFDQNEYDLPNAERPDCHKHGTTYPGVYGRIYGDKPVSTLTTGFMSPGRGRFTHPTQRRTLTPHEGARLQGFPDSFEFGIDGATLTRTNFAKIIGDAVPPPLGYAIGLACLSVL